MTVQKALQVISQPLGLTVDQNRDQLLRNLNEIRDLMYSAYQQFSVAVDREVCITLRDYYLDCAKCTNSYRGITLPYDAAGTESLKIEGIEIDRFSEYKNKHKCRPIEAYDVLMPTPTQNEIPCNTSGFLTVLGNRDDHGKFVNIKYRDCQGNRRTEKLAVCDDSNNQTSLAASWVDEVSLELGRKHPVSLYQKAATGTNDCLLSKYLPEEIAPAYIRIRFNIGKATCPESVKVIYNRTFFDVTEDEELVETNSRYALKEFAAYLSLNNRPNNTGGDRDEAKQRLGQASNALVGTQRREEGANQIHVLTTHGGFPRSSGLISKRR